MDDPKCKICGNRHRLGPCGGSVVPRRVVLSGKGATSAIRLALTTTPAPAISVEGQVPATHRLRSLAPEGECPYCDYRRAAAARSMRTRRAKDKKAKRRVKRKETP